MADGTAGITGSAAQTKFNIPFLKEAPMPRTHPLPTLAKLGITIALVAAPTVLLATPASALANVTRADYSAGNLRIEGNAIWNRPITVDGVVMATSDGGGTFKISRSGYTPPADCTVDVNDGSSRPTTVRLNGCTVTAVPAPAEMTPDSAEIGPFTVGQRVGSTPVNFVGSIGPTSWQITAGALPSGLSMVVPTPTQRPLPNTPQQLTYALIEGTPTAAGTSTVTFHATDVNGLVTTRTYTIRVNPAVPVAITPEPWNPVTVGSFSNLWIDGSGGLVPYSWAVTAGALPSGMTLIQDAANGPSVRVGGTPTAEGTYDWTLKLTDVQGATTSRAFSVTVGPVPAPAPEPTAAPSPTPAPVAVSIASLSLDSTSVPGGTTSTGTLTLTTAAPADGTAVILSSSNPQAAAVPSTATVPAGATSATFPITTGTVAASTTVAIEATYSGTLTAHLTITAASTLATDTVSVTRAEYDSAKQQLRVDAGSSGTGATLQVFLTGTGTLIGTLSGGSGQFAVAATPQSVTVRSSLGGSAARTVTVR
jgi:Putative Ig domain